MTVAKAIQPKPTNPPLFMTQHSVSLNHPAPAIGRFLFIAVGILGSIIFFAHSGEQFKKDRESRSVSRALVLKQMVVDGQQVSPQQLFWLYDKTYADLEYGEVRVVFQKNYGHLTELPVSRATFLKDLAAQYIGEKRLVLR